MKRGYSSMNEDHSASSSSTTPENPFHGFFDTAIGQALFVDKIRSYCSIVDLLHLSLTGGRQLQPLVQTFHLPEIMQEQNINIPYSKDRMDAGKQVNQQVIQYRQQGVGRVGRPCRLVAENPYKAYYVNLYHPDEVPHVQAAIRRYLAKWDLLQIVSCPEEEEAAAEDQEDMNENNNNNNGMPQEEDRPSNNAQDDDDLWLISAKYLPVGPYHAVPPAYRTRCNVTETIRKIVRAKGRLRLYPKHRHHVADEFVAMFLAVTNHDWYRSLFGSPAPTAKQMKLELVVETANGTTSRRVFRDHSEIDMKLRVDTPPEAV